MIRRIHSCHFVHAETAARQVAAARLSPFHLAGHILWLGPEASAMHEARVNFLRGPEGAA